MKKHKNKLYKTTNSSEVAEVKNIVKVLGGVLLFFAMFYLGYAIVSGELTFGKKAKEETVIQDNEILAGTTFKRDRDEYMVLFFDMENRNEMMYGTIYENYNGNIKLYISDTSMAVNAPYVAKEESSNKNPKTAKDLKIKGATLIKIKNGTVEKYLEGLTEIKEYINSLNIES